MKFFFSLATCAILTLLATSSAAEVGSKLVSSGRKLQDDFQALVNIGNKRPEGIHMIPRGEETSIGLAEGVWALVGELAYGGIKAVNVETGDIVQLVDSTGFSSRAIVGLWYYNGAIFAAGGGTAFGLEPMLHVFSGATGDLIASCSPEVPGGVINDVTVSGTTAYATDSFRNSLMVLDADAALSGDCAVSSIPLPAELFQSVGGEFLANGIIPFANGLLIIQSAGVNETEGGALYYLDLTANNELTEVLPAGTLLGADGLAIADGETTLYITQNVLNLVSAWAMDVIEGQVTATLLGRIVSPLFDSPATTDVSGEYIFSVNARFSSLAFPDPGEGDPETFAETFDVVGRNRRDFEVTLPAASLAPSMSPTRAPSPASPTTDALPTMSPTADSAAASFPTSYLAAAFTSMCLNTIWMVLY